MGIAVGLFALRGERSSHRACSLRTQETAGQQIVPKPIGDVAEPQGRVGVERDHRRNWRVLHELEELVPDCRQLTPLDPQRGHRNSPVTLWYPRTRGVHTLGYNRELP